MDDVNIMYDSMVTVGTNTYTVSFPVFKVTGCLCRLNAVVKKQQNVNAAITLNVKANIVLRRDKNVFILINRTGVQ